ncbi:MAG: hypothetical protein ACLFPX_04380 [Candidatus Omnitrophota bacterium]
MKNQRGVASLVGLLIVLVIFYTLYLMISKIYFTGPMGTSDDAQTRQALGGAGAGQSSQNPSGTDARTRGTVLDSARSKLEGINQRNQRQGAAIMQQIEGMQQ